jgi:hypothetical protein
MQIAFTLPMLNFRPKVNQNAVHRAADQPTVFPARPKSGRAQCKPTEHPVPGPSTETKMRNLFIRRG